MDPAEELAERILTELTNKIAWAAGTTFGIPYHKGLMRRMSLDAAEIFFAARKELTDNSDGLQKTWGPSGNA
jgi:hypothetical protein